MQCFYPVRICDPNTNEFMSVPCGHCFACQSNRRKDWHMRIKYELLHNVCSYTVTLTYDNEHLPKPVLFGKESLHNSGIKELDKIEEDLLLETTGFWYHPYQIEDVQKFFKRLRKKGLVFRYFGVAEYGGKTARPHYHIIFFFDRFVSKVKFQTEVFHSWPLGCQIVIDETNDDCIGYTLKYCLKFYNVKQPQPKIFLSKRPFIGNGYLSESTVTFLRTHPGDVVRTVSGVRRLPRLIRDKVYDDDMKEFNKSIILETIDKVVQNNQRIADELNISLDEYNNRLRESFTEKCIRSLKKKSI